MGRWTLAWWQLAHEPFWSVWAFGSPDAEALLGWSPLPFLKLPAILSPSVRSHKTSPRPSRVLGQAVASPKGPSGKQQTRLGLVCSGGYVVCGV